MWCEAVCIYFSGCVQSIPGYRQDALPSGDPGENWQYTQVTADGGLYKSTQGKVGLTAVTQTNQIGLFYPFLSGEGGWVAALETTCINILLDAVVWFTY